jgi:hypothetical protein
MPAVSGILLRLARHAHLHRYRQTLYRLPRPARSLRLRRLPTHQPAHQLTEERALWHVRILRAAEVDQDAQADMGTLVLRDHGEQAPPAVGAAEHRLGRRLGHTAHQDEVAHLQMGVHRVEEARLQHLVDRAVVGIAPQHPLLAALRGQGSQNLALVAGHDGLQSLAG